MGKIPSAVSHVLSLSSLIYTCKYIYKSPLLKGKPLLRGETPCVGKGGVREKLAQCRMLVLFPLSYTYLYIYINLPFLGGNPLCREEGQREKSSRYRMLFLSVSLSVCLSVSLVRARARALSLPHTRSFAFMLFPLLCFPLSNLPR